MRNLIKMEARMRGLMKEEMKVPILMGRMMGKGKERRRGRKMRLRTIWDRRNQRMMSWCRQMKTSIQFLHSSSSSTAPNRQVSRRLLGLWSSITQSIKLTKSMEPLHYEAPKSRESRSSNVLMILELWSICQRLLTLFCFWLMLVWDFKWRHFNSCPCLNVMAFLM